MGFVVVLLEHLQQFDIFCLSFVVVRQLSKRYGKWEKKDHFQVFGIIDLTKTKIVDPTVFAATFLPRRI